MSDTAQRQTQPFDEWFYCRRRQKLVRTPCTRGAERNGCVPGTCRYVAGVGTKGGGGKGMARHPRYRATNPSGTAESPYGSEAAIKRQGERHETVVHRGERHPPLHERLRAPTAHEVSPQRPARDAIAPTSRVIAQYEQQVDHAAAAQARADREEAATVRLLEHWEAAFDQQVAAGEGLTVTQAQDLGSHARAIGDSEQTTPEGGASPTDWHLVMPTTGLDGAGAGDPLQIAFVAPGGDPVAFVCDPLGNGVENAMVSALMPVPGAETPLADGDLWPAVVGDVLPAGEVDSPLADPLAEAGIGDPLADPFCDPLAVPGDDVNGP